MIAAKKSDGFVKTFIRQYREGGILSFYKTSFASAVLCINPAITYMIFEALKLRILRRRNSKSGLLGTLEALFVGILAKSIATLITFPLIRAKGVCIIQMTPGRSISSTKSHNFLLLSSSSYECR